MLTQQTLNTISKYNMFKLGDRVLVGVSGGPDSVALLLVLHSLKKELGLKLYVASLNHMFRKDAASDVEFVKKLAAKLKASFLAGKVNVSKLHDSRGGSKEDTARTVRYDFFLKAAKKFNVNKIALGHTRDDQAETVLMRLIYGAGITGLSGILPARKFEKYLVVRPLIEASRKDIELYLKDNKIKPRHDSTNSQDEYKRNKIRKHLIPIFEKNYNPGIKQALSRTAALLRDDRDLLEEVLLKPVFKKIIKTGKNNIVRLNLKELDKLHVALKKYVLRECIRRVNLKLVGIEYRHWRLIEAFIAKRKNNAAWHLPYGCRVRIKKGAVIFFNEGIKPQG